MSLSFVTKWKTSIDRGKVFGALLAGLSKAFDCLNHDLLIAKLNAYGLSLPALRLIHDYLLSKKQRTRINNSYSTRIEINFGVPQGSIRDPFCSTFSLQICSSLEIAWILQIMQMTINHMLLLPMI